MLDKCYHSTMIKRLLTILSILLILPVYSADTSKLATVNNKAILYMYTKECSYCDKFAPNYSKLEKTYDKKCRFLKQDASTEYGTQLMREFKAFYVPFVVFIDYDRHIIQRVAPTCLLNYACVKDAVDKFVEN